MPGGGGGGGEDRLQNLNDLLTRQRDSGTSSPQPLEPLRSRSQAQLVNQKQQQQPQVLLNVETIETTEVTTTQTIQPHQTTSSATTAFTAHSPLNIDNTIAHHNNAAAATAAAEEESDSNDSVFSSSSSINSINCCDPTLTSYSMPDFREVYLGGSCVLRTKWRQEIAIPYLKAKGISYHIPSLHESINATQLDLPEQKLAQNETEVSGETGDMRNWRMRRQPTSAAANFMRTRRKCRTNSGTKLAEEVEEVTIAEESLSWTLAPVVRTNLFNPAILDSSRVLLFVITNETRSLAPMTLAAHCIGLMYNVVLAVQMLPNDCVIGNEKVCLM